MDYKPLLKSNRLNQINSRYIIQVNLSENRQYMSSKIDKIRRKLQQNRKKSIFQNLTVNQNLSHLLFKINKTNNHQNFINQASFTPISSICNTRDLSTDHSEHSWKVNQSTSNSPLCESNKYYQSIFLDKAGSYTHYNTELTTKSLNPTARSIMKLNEKKRIITERIEVQNKIINNQTSNAVIIFADKKSLKSNFRVKRSHRIAQKHRSIAQRTTITPEKQLSPFRKYSISAWETFED